MKNKHLTVFNELNEQLLNYPRDTLWDKYLQTIVNEQLRKLKYSDEGFEPEKLSRQQIYAKAKNTDERKIDSQLAKNAVKISKLELTLAAFIENQPDCKRAFIDLGYQPIIVTSASGGGSKNKTLIWMDIEVIESEDVAQEQIDGSSAVESDEELEDVSSVTYERKATSDIKLSLLVRLFFKKGELKMLSVSGVSLMLLLILSALVDIFIVIYSILVLLLLSDLPSFKLWQAIVFVVFIPVAYLNWRYFLMPLQSLPQHRVIKAPMFFANINDDNADIEMYRNKDKLNIARVTEFTAVCPICSGVIELANGRPDQKVPLVGRCKEAPHAHVYSFDRMTMKGYFLGVSDYLKNSNLSI